MRGSAGVAILAVAVALLTGLAVWLTAAAPWHGYGAALYLLITLIAVATPTAIVVQILAGQLLAGSLLIPPASPVDLPTLMLVVGSVLASAELLGVAARLDGPLGRAPRDDLIQGVGRSLAGAGVFGVVLWVARSIGAGAGPTGFLALGVAVGVSALAAVVVAGGSLRAQQPRE